MDSRWTLFGEDETHLAAHRFVPEALTVARELRGHTKAELAALVNKTPGAITQFESGITKPDARTLKAIGLALGLPAGFFANPNQPLAVDRCHFRSLRATSQRERRRILARGVILQRLFQVLSEYAEIPEEKISVLGRPVKSDDEIESLAVELRKFWGLGLGPIPNLIGLLESKGIIVSFIPADSREIDAFSTWQGGRPYIYLVPTKGVPTRTRFDCAHELGHLVMHMDASPGSRFLETQAHRFSGAFLIPKESFVRECPRRLDWDHLYELKRRWRVSVAAIIKRAHDLDWMSDATYRRAFVQLSQRGERDLEPMEPLPETPSLLSQCMAFALEQVSIVELAQAVCLKPEELSAFCASIESSGGGQIGVDFCPTSAQQLPRTGGH